MRNTLSAGTALLFLAAVSWAARPDAGAGATSAIGEGTMSFGRDDDDGVAYLRFSIADGPTVTGSLLFAGEHHHHMFPDVVVELGNIQQARFDAHSVEFSGPGKLHDDQVTVTVIAYDEEVNERADRFVIKCADSDGEIVFEADGELFRGDIQVGSA